MVKGQFLALSRESLVKICSTRKSDKPGGCDEVIVGRLGLYRPYRPTCSAMKSPWGTPVKALLAHLGSTTSTPRARTAKKEDLAARENPSAPASTNIRGRGAIHHQRTHMSPTRERTTTNNICHCIDQTSRSTLGAATARCW